MKSVSVSALALAGLCAATAVQAADVDVGVDFKSAYVATGATCNDGWTAMPWLSASGFKVGDTEIPLVFDFWGAMDLERYTPNRPYSRVGRFQEIDLDVMLDLAKVAPLDDDFSYSIGYLEYDYPEQPAETDNLILFTAGYDCPLAPSFTTKYRIGGPSAGKFECALAVSHGITLDEDNGIGLDFSADVWYVNVEDADNKWDAESGERAARSGFACMDFTASLSIQKAYVGVTYVARLDDDVLPDGPYGYDAKWIASCGISYGF